MHDPIHPGKFIRQNVIPKDTTVKDLAKLLGIGRPALSNLLNGKAALSPEMATRLEKAFGADPQKLLKLRPITSSINSVVKPQILRLARMFLRF